MFVRIHWFHHNDDFTKLICQMHCIPKRNKKKWKYHNNSFSRPRYEICEMIYTFGGQLRRSYLSRARQLSVSAGSEGKLRIKYCAHRGLTFTRCYRAEPSTINSLLPHCRAVSHGEQLPTGNFFTVQLRFSYWKRMRWALFGFSPIHFRGISRSNSWKWFEHRRIFCSNISQVI